MAEEQQQQQQTDPAAWNTLKVSLAGGNADYAKALETYDAPEKLFAKLGEKPEAPDWRKVVAGESEDDLKALERFADPGMFLKSYRDTQTALRNDGRVKVPGEGASDEERAAFAKAMGVPEKADGYQITAKPVEGYEVGDGDKAFLGDMTTKIHEALARGAKPNEIVNIAHQLYFDAAAAGVVNAENRAADAAAEGERENRGLWGSRYDDNIKTAIAGAKQFFPGDDEAFEKFMGLKLETGHALFDHPTFQRMFAQVGLQFAEDPFFQQMKSENKGFDPLARKEEIMKLRTTDPQKYASAPIQAELDKINAGLERQQQKSRAA